MTQTFFPFFLILFLLLRGAAYAQAPDTWELKKNEDGIAVYTRTVNDLSVKQIKVVCELPGTPGQLVQIIKDVEHHPKWVYLNQKALLLKRKSENNFIYYSVINMPWPVADRDMISEAVVFPADKNKKVRIQVNGLSDYLPKKNPLVRIPYSMAVWEITPVAKNRMKVVYTFNVDPGGTLPAWMVNTFVTTGPYITFSRLRERLEDLQKPGSK